MRSLSLDQLTVAGVSPAELVEVAARAGYQAVSPFVCGRDIGDLRVWPLVAGDPETEAMRRKLRDTGIFINIADGFALFEDADMEALRAGIDLMAEMGARGIVTLQFDGDEARGFERFCQLNEWAGEAGLPLLLEFTALSEVGSLTDALAYREKVGSDNIALLVDLFHLNRSGEPVARLADLAPGIVKGAQLCDGTLKQSNAEYLDQAMHARDIPGEGELPVREFLSALPDDLTVGVEVPHRTMRNAGVGPLERARRIREACDALLA